jgi:hypothetical protein
MGSGIGDIADPIFTVSESKNFVTFSSVETLLVFILILS